MRTISEIEQFAIAGGDGDAPPQCPQNTQCLNPDSISDGYQNTGWDQFYDALNP